MIDDHHLLRSFDSAYDGCDWMDAISTQSTGYSSSQASTNVDERVAIHVQMLDSGKVATIYGDDPLQRGSSKAPHFKSGIRAKSYSRRKSISGGKTITRANVSERFNACVPCRSRKIRCIPNASSKHDDHLSCGTCVKRGKTCTWPSNIQRSTKSLVAGHADDDKDLYNSHFMTHGHQNSLPRHLASASTDPTLPVTISLVEEDAEGEDELAPDLQPSESIGVQLAACLETIPHVSQYDIVGRTSVEHRNRPSYLAIPTLECSFMDAPPVSSPLTPMTDITYSTPPSTASSNFSSFSNLTSEYLGTTPYSPQQWAHTCENSEKTSMDSRTQSGWNTITPSMLTCSFDIPGVQTTSLSAFANGQIGISNGEAVVGLPAVPSLTTQLDWNTSDFIPLSYGEQ